MVVGHLVGQKEVSRVVVTHYLGLAGAQVHKLEEELTVVILVAPVSPCGICLEHTFAKVPVLGSGHSGRIGRYRDAELVLESVVLCQEVGAQLVADGRSLGVYLAEFFLICLAEADSVALEGLVEPLENHLLLAGEAALICVVDGCDPLVEVLVHIDVVAVLGLQRGCLLHYGLQLGRILGLCHIVKNSHHLGKDTSGEFQGGNCVVKCRRVRIVYDGLYLRLLLGNSRLDGRHIMLYLYLVIWRDSVWGIPLLKEWILLFGRTRCESNCCCHDQ